MRARLVTAYVPIPDHPRTAAEYGAYGEKLGAVPVPKKAYYDQLPNLWLWQHAKNMRVRPAISHGDNPAKNTLNYHAVNHEKTRWLVQAMDDEIDDDVGVYVWVDYGIFHQPGVCNEAIYNFMHALDDKAIYIPGCWEPSPVESVYPCWRFCGSVLAVPKQYVRQFDHAVRETARQHIDRTNNVEWEVNTWARVEQSRKFKLPIQWYAADHDVTQFTNHPSIRKPQ